MTLSFAPQITATGQSQLRGVGSQDGSLPTVDELAFGQRVQRFADAVEALVFQKVVDQLTAHEIWIVEELLQRRLQLAPRGGADKGFDVIGIDILSQSGRADEGQ